MKTTPEEHTSFQLVTTAHLGEEGLTLELIKNHEARGRRLRSEYFVGFLKRSGRMAKDLSLWTGKVFGRIFGVT